MKNVVLFGGTGGLGTKLVPFLSKKYNVMPIGSKLIDVRDYDEVEKFFTDNEIDIVINASGVNYDKFIHKYDKNSQHQIDGQIDVNIKGNINILSCCLPKMREKGYGRIILFSSVLATSPVISTGIYSACKSFIDSLVKTTSLENAFKGITCNSLQLGYFDGGLTYKIPEVFRENILKEIPMGRWGKIEELYNLIEMLIQTEYITGTNQKMNGGIYCG